MKRSPLGRKAALARRTALERGTLFERTTRTPRLEQAKPCEHCGRIFVPSRDHSKYSQLYCSRLCFGAAFAKRKRAADPPRVEVQRLVRQGLSDKELGALYGRSYQWALKLRQRYDIPGNDPARRARKALNHQGDRARWNLELKGGERQCRNCGYRGGPIHLHHAIPRSMCRATKYDLRNGIPLCTRCHLGWHHRRVTLYRDIFTQEEWAYIASVSLTGQEIGPWLDERYPERPVEAAA